MKTDYLRISIADKCNLKCMYCHPFSEKDFIPHDEILRFEEITKILGLLTPLGIRKVRITGGEPLIKRGIEDLVPMLKEVPGIEEVNITTNGVLLGEKYDDLVRSGIDRINVSLNTLRRERYKILTGADHLDSVVRTIGRISEDRRCLLKINTILFKGINDDEITDLVDFAIRHDICVRFIEYYSTKNDMKWLEKARISTSVVREVIERRFGPLERDHGFLDNGPARTFLLEGNRGSVGFISSHSEDFCGHCTRLRLSSDGKLFPCLFSPDYLDVKRLVREGFPGAYITEELCGVITGKENCSKNNENKYDFCLKSIGG